MKTHVALLLFVAGILNPAWLPAAVPRDLCVAYLEWAQLENIRRRVVGNEIIFSEAQRRGLRGAIVDGRRRLRALWKRAVDFGPSATRSFLSDEFNHKIRVPDGEVYTGDANRFAFSSDGKSAAFVLSRRDGSEAKLLYWDSQNPERAATLSPLNSENKYRCLAGNPTATRVLLGSEAGQVERWDLASDKLPVALPASHLAPVDWCAVSARGNIGISASRKDGAVKVWNLEAGTLLFNVESDPDSTLETISSVALSLDGERLALGSSRGKIEIWNIPDKKRTEIFRIDHSPLNLSKMAPGRLGILPFFPDVPLVKLAFTADNHRLAALNAKPFPGPGRSTAHLWMIEPDALSQGQPKIIAYRIDAMGGGKDLAFLPGGRVRVLGDPQDLKSSSTTVAELDLKTGFTVSSFGLGPFHFALSPNGQFVFANLTDGPQVVPLLSRAPELRAVPSSGIKFIKPHVGGWAESEEPEEPQYRKPPGIRLDTKELTAMVPITTSNSPGLGVRRLVFSADEKRILALSVDARTISLLDGRTLRPTGFLHAAGSPANYFTDARFAPGADEIFASDIEGNLTRFNCKTWRAKRVTPGMNAQTFWVTPDGRKLITFDPHASAPRSHLEIRDPDSMSVINGLSFEKPVSVAVSADGHLALVVENYKTAKIVDLDTGITIFTEQLEEERHVGGNLEDPDNFAYLSAFSPGGHFAVILQRNGQLKRLDLSRPRGFVTIRVERMRAADFGILPSGTVLVTGTDSSGTAYRRHAIDLVTGEENAQFRAGTGPEDDATVFAISPNGKSWVYGGPNARSIGKERLDVLKNPPP